MANSRRCAVCRLYQGPASFPTVRDDPDKLYPTCRSCCHIAFPTDALWIEAGLLVKKAAAASKRSGRKAKVDGNTQDKAEVSSLKRKRTQPIRYAPSLEPVKPKKRRVPAQTHLTCRICVDEQPVAHFPSPHRIYHHGSIPFGCQQHLGRKSKIGAVCNECITTWLSNCVEQPSGAENMRCLDPGCTSIWTFDHVQGFIGHTSAFATYLDGLFNAWKYTVKWLDCTNPVCDGRGLLDFAAVGFPHVECNKCQHRMCATCNVDWHHDLTCQQYRAKHKVHEMDDHERNDLEKLAKEGYKRCPRCATIYIRESGCEWVYCSSCHQGFADNMAEPVQATTDQTKWRLGEWTDRNGMLAAHNLRHQPGCEADNLARLQAEAEQRRRAEEEVEAQKKRQEAAASQHKPRNRREQTALKQS